ncbi:MAG: hypothetical protein ABSF77_14530 [Spirochaetia bacterium]|jgi:hypothetical protein
MKKMSLFMALFASLVLVSCATTYQPAGYTGGYRDFHASNEQYFVYFEANGYTDAQTAYQFFLTRAAEIALNNGYPYFYILQSQDISRTETYYTPGTAQTTITSNVYRTYSRYGNIGYLDTSVYSTAVTTYTPPQAYYVNKPGFRGQILLAKEQIKDQPPPFDAKVVYRDGMDLNARVESRNKTVGMIAGIGTALFVVVSVTFYR